jgi:methyl-accepting chemotaxis protein
VLEYVSTFALVRTFPKRCRMDANASTHDDLGQLAQSFDLTDGDLSDLAQRAAESVQRLANLWTRLGTQPAIVLQSMRKIVKGYGLNMPCKDGLKQLMNRLSDPAWWRRSLRKRMRVVELNEIRKGRVHKGASPYVSNKALRRFDRRRHCLTEIISSLDAVNTATGEVVPLKDIAESSQANPD